MTVQLFMHDKRLGIPVPTFLDNLNDLSEETRNSVLYQWEVIRGTIPDRIAELEKEINVKQKQLSEETDFDTSCQLNEEISELASIINDLWIWFRKNEVSSASKPLH